MMSLGLGLGLGGGAQGSGGAPPTINPNLLVKTEQFDATAWVSSLAVVTPNAGADPLGGMTADLVDLSGGGGSASLRQATTIACSVVTGGIQFATLPQALTRVSITAVVDGSPYTLSLWMAEPTNSQPDAVLQILSVGGFLNVKLLTSDIAPPYLCWGAKLEVGSTATGDATNYGAVN